MPDPSAILEKFRCLGCGACCRWPGYVRVTDAELPILAQAAGLTEAEFRDRHTRLTTDRRGLSLCENRDGSCEFLRADNRCALYAVRPHQCRVFPFAWTAGPYMAQCAGWRAASGAIGAGDPGSCQ